MPDDFAGYDEIWVGDFEYLGGDTGGHYDVVCLAAKELLSKRTVKLWRDELGALPPYRTDTRALFVCFAAHAELGCHLALGWPLPERMLDLSPEYRNLVNGRAGKDDRRGLLDAMRRFGLPAISRAEKEYWRDVVLRGPPWTDSDRAGILDYCMSDVTETAALFDRMRPDLDMPRAMLRGESVVVSAVMEYNGIPFDMGIFSRLRDQGTWDEIRESLVPILDATYQVFDGATFKNAKFETYLTRENIPWPRLDSGRLDLSTKTFRAKAKAYPQQIGPLHELRETLSKMRSIKLTVGPDGRARTVLWPFASKTGRTQPSGSQYVFGPAVWVRGLIKPGPGMAVAYVDMSAIEFGIAAGLSSDRKMLEAYASDPYLGTAIAFGYAPPGATKRTHRAVRDQFKIVLLAAQYGMTAESLAAWLGISLAEARELQRKHRAVYAVYWRWSDAQLALTLTSGRAYTCYGWQYHVGDPVKERTLRNWPIQSHGSEILRLVCIRAHRAGLRLLAPVHDALLIEAPVDRIEADVALLQEIMASTSRIVLNGALTLRSDAQIVRYPDRYADPRGERMWSVVLEQLERLSPTEEERHVAAG
jgi:hypothetical protein